MNESELAREFVATGECASCGVIDMHGHPDRFGRIYFPVGEPAQMVRGMDEAGVMLSCGSTHEALLGDMEEGNAKMGGLVEAYPKHFRAYAVMNGNFPEKIAAELARWDARRGFIGFKLHPTMHEYTVTGEANAPVFAFAEERGLVVLSHTWGKDERCRPELFADLAERYGNVTWLLGHSGYGDWEAAARVAREHANVYLELTAAYAVGGVIETFTELAGGGKIVFGCDYPWFDYHYAIGCVLFARISEEDRRRILHDNAREILAGVGVDVEARERL